MARQIGANSAIVKQQNMAAVKLILYQQAPMSRMDIAARLGLTPPTITNITADLIAQGYVEEVESETEEPARGAGRKPILINLKRDAFTVLGITLGRDSTRLCFCDVRGAVLGQAVYEVMNDDYAVMVHQLEGILSNVRREYAELWAKLLGIGISIPGVINAHQGRVKNHGRERTSWKEQPLGEEISRFAGLPVRVENNVKARANAISLFWPELLDGENIFALCYVSFGIACPFVLENRLFRGGNSAAGELGKVIVRPDLKEDPGFAPPGSLEALSSVTAILKQCREAMSSGTETLLRDLCPDAEKLNLSHVLEAQNQKDALVCRVMNEAMYYLGIALANVVDIINPHLILLSGPLFVNRQNADTVEQNLRAHAILPDDEAVRIVPLDMGENAGAIGAAACCIEKYFLRQ